MNFQDYIKTELLILIPVLYFLGVGLKESRLPDKWIPLSIGLIGAILSAVWVFATSNVSCAKEIALAIFTSFTQGVLVAGASVYANQLYIQAKKDE